MKLSQETLAYIQQVINTAGVVKIDSIIIEPNRVRAIDDTRTVFILQTTNVPDMEFGSIGLNRTGVLTSRLELGKSLSDFTVDATVEGTDPATMYARSLVMKAKGIKVDYRCANPLVMKAPKTLNDTNAFRVTINPEAVLMLQKGQMAMTSDEVRFTSSDDGPVFFEMSDINSDILKYEFADMSTKLSDEDDAASDFSHSYPLKTLLPLFKLNPTGYFILTSQGVMKIVINGLDIYVFPKA